MGSRKEPTGTRPFGARFTFPLLLGSTLNPINSSMIATGLVGIAADFHTGPGQTATLVSVLYLCSAVMQPTMGKLSTLFGPRRVFLIGIGILFLGGLTGAAAPAFGFLLVSRALIGIGTSAAYPTAMALVRRRADGLGTGIPSRVLGNFSIASQVATVFGLPIGGVLAGAFGWRALFLVNIPLAIIVFAFAARGIARDPIPATDRGNVLKAIDLPGIALFAAGIVALLLFLSDLTDPAWWVLIVAALLLTTLLLWERRVDRPLIDVRMLARNSPLQRTYLRQTLVGLGIYTTLYGASQWMEQGAGLSPFTVGLILLPLSAASIVLARINSNKGWIRYPLIAGAGTLVLTGAAILLLHSGSNVLVIGLVGTTLLLGVTNGFSGFANQATLYLQAPAEDIAVAAGLYRTFAYVGAIFSASLIGIVFGPRITDDGFHRLGWVIIGIGVVSLLLTVLDRRIPVLAHPDEPAP
ncbi:MFS transporter [Leifsonia poae]|uniref:MFS transporter n=1 Tax=Leifsonia poae TaxID=110933 RepID=UPI001CBE1197|nr:MFS transporter [Leifsonia poae]